MSKLKSRLFEYLYHQLQHLFENIVHIEERNNELTIYAPYEVIEKLFTILNVFEVGAYIEKEYNEHGKKTYILRVVFNQ